MMIKTKKVNKFILIVLLIILLLALAVGYAIFTDILTIQGTANAKGTFDLEFQNAGIVKSQGVNEEKTKVEISEDKNTLTVNVVDLAYPGAGVEFSVDIVNVGTIPVKVQAVKQTNINGSENIKVRGLEEINADHPTIGAGDKCNIHFVVEIPEEVTEIAENESISFGLEIEYVQATGEVFTGNTAHIDGKIKEIPEYTVPTGIKVAYGQTLADIELPEGFSFQDSLEKTVGELGKNVFKVTYTPENTENYNIITDIEITIEVIETLVSKITGADYGKKINYSTTVQGETVDNWKIFYNDGQNVYIILDDYLQNRLVPSEAGLQISKTYVVYSNNRSTLMNGLTTESYWIEFAGGVEGAIATGTPTAEMLMASYNEKNGTNLSYINKPTLDTSDNLYFPHTELTEGCSAYWLASIYNGNSKDVWISTYYGYLYNYTPSSSLNYITIRPVVKLPSNLIGTVGETVEI